MEKHFLLPQRKISKRFFFFFFNIGYKILKIQLYDISECNVPLYKSFAANYCKIHLRFGLYTQRVTWLIFIKHVTLNIYNIHSSTRSRNQTVIG